LKVREQALKRDDYICQHCFHRDGILTPATAVDHIIPFTSNSDPRRLDVNNLMSLCTPCHSRKTVEQDGGFGRVKKIRPV
jgi:5-methylcytosine-specific restriction protein A